MTVAQGIGMTIPWNMDSELYFVDNFLDYTEVARRIQQGVPPDPNRPDLLTDAELASFFGPPPANFTWSNRAELMAYLLHGQQ